MRCSKGHDVGSGGTKTEPCYLPNLSETLKDSDQKFSIIHWLSKKFKTDIQHFLSTDKKWSIFLLPPRCSPTHLVSKLYPQNPMFGERAPKITIVGLRNEAGKKEQVLSSCILLYPWKLQFSYLIWWVEFDVMGFAGGSDSKESACNARDLDSGPGSERSPGEGGWLPTPVFLPGEFHGQRSLAGYTPWDCKDSDTTE